MQFAVVTKAELRNQNSSSAANECVVADNDSACLARPRTDEDILFNYCTRSNYDLIRVNHSLDLRQSNLLE